MIEINLLPEAYRKKTLAPAKKFPFLTVLLVSDAILLAIFLICSAISLAKVITLHALKTRLENLAPEKRKIMDIRQKTDELKKNNELFSQLFTSSFLWTKKLNKISDLLVPGIWLQNISLEKETVKVAAMAKGKIPTSVQKRYLMINGTVYSTTKDEMAVVGEFMRNLKADIDFFDDFKNLELESILRRKIVSIEVMDFTLVCRFKEGLKF